MLEHGSFEQQEIVRSIRQFVDREVIPSAADYERSDTYPEPLVERMKELGLFGVTIPEAFGGLGLGLTTYALIQIELSRGWMSLSGVLNTHFISAWLIKTYGTEQQHERYLPRITTGDLRAAYSMTEPHAGSDVQSIRTVAVRDGDTYGITGQKMWATNGLRSGIVLLLTKTDPEAVPPHRGMTAFIVEKPAGASEAPGLTIPPPLKKLGYKGVESTELIFDDFRTPATSVLGGEAGAGLPAVHERGRARAHQCRGSRRRDRARRLRAVDPVRPAARDVRPADRPAPGDPAQAGADGHAARGVAPAGAGGRPQEGPRGARGPRGGHGQAVRHGDGAGVGARGHADPRRLRVLARVRGGAPVPTLRCSAWARGPTRSSRS
jgi:alkylation response protein AidB-like acyl-CoA dehydrogenase